MVRREARDSTYRQSLALVEAAQSSSAPLVRIADRYSVVFTAIAISIAAAAWWSSGSLTRALAVLVVATPCPLILAVPIALMGGVNRAAGDKIDLVWREHLNQALAVLHTMREADEDMAAAGDPDVWRKMVEVAIGERVD